MNDTQQSPDRETSTAASVKVQILAAGFNAHHQILQSDGDVSEFARVLDATSRTSILFAGWSTTVFAGSKSLVALGFQQIEPQVEGGDGSAENLRSGFGDHDGMLGCLDNEGRLYLAQPPDGPAGADQEDRLCCRSLEASPLISHIAYAQNGRVALTFKQAPNGQLCHLVQFATFEAFQSWFEDPSNEGNYPESHHMLPGRPKQLLAGTAHFVLLMEAGNVFTSGDARYESLARPISGEDAVPAGQPGLVDALGGLKIVSVATGGWISAALSEDGALYVWGTVSPGREGSIGVLDKAEAGGVSLVDITGPGSAGSEPLDISHVAVGDNHILVIAGEDGYIFAVGDNHNGQLGLVPAREFYSDWQQVLKIRNAESVFCGPNSSWVIVGDQG